MCNRLTLLVSFDEMQNSAEYEFQLITGSIEIIALENGKMVYSKVWKLYT